MKTNLLKWSAIALVPVAALLLTSCKSEHKGKETTMFTAQQGVPGGTLVKTYQITATVTGIDADKRKVTLVGPEGEKVTFKAGPEVVNFDQIQVGDRVKATMTEEMVVSMATEATPQNEPAVTTVALAPVGAKPGGYVADTVQITARVVAIDLKKHQATLEFPDGKKKTFPVRPDVDLTQRKVGEQVVFRATEAIAISVEKP